MPLTFYAMHQAAQAFETIFTGELSVADVYFATEKKGLSNYRLASEGEVLFPSDLAIKVPEAVSDLRACGRCLAFELCTAAGFHLLRALESVIRRYWTVVTDGKPHPKERAIGVYLKRMNELGVGDDKLKAALGQLKDLHRNPLFHPEDNLDLEEAIALIGVVQGILSGMLKAIPLQGQDSPQMPLPPPSSDLGEAV